MKTSNLFRFLNLRTLIGPWLIRAFYWLGVVSIVAAGINAMFSAVAEHAGIARLVLAVLAALASLAIWRVLSELLLVVFKIQDHLAAISAACAIQARTLEQHQAQAQEPPVGFRETWPRDTGQPRTALPARR